MTGPRPRGLPLEPDEFQEMRRLAKSGMRPKLVAKLTGLHYETVRKYTRRHGWAPPALARVAHPKDVRVKLTEAEHTELLARARARGSSVAHFGRMLVIEALSKEDTHGRG